MPGPMSDQFGGPKGNTPYVPSWMEPMNEEAFPPWHALTPEQAWQKGYGKADEYLERAHMAERECDRLRNMATALRAVCEATAGASDFGMARKAYEVAAKALYDAGLNVLFLGAEIGSGGRCGPERTGGYLRSRCRGAGWSAQAGPFCAPPGLLSFTSFYSDLTAPGQPCR